MLLFQATLPMWTKAYKIFAHKSSFKFFLANQTEDLNILQPVITKNNYFLPQKKIICKFISQKTVLFILLRICFKKNKICMMSQRKMTNTKFKVDMSTSRKFNFLNFFRIKKYIYNTVMNKIKYQSYQPFLHQPCYCQ